MWRLRGEREEPVKEREARVCLVDDGKQGCMPEGAMEGKRTDRSRLRGDSVARPWESVPGASDSWPSLSSCVQVSKRVSQGVREISSSRRRGSSKSFDNRTTEDDDGDGKGVTRCIAVGDRRASR